MLNIIKTLNENKVFFITLFCLLISGLTDFISTEININVLHIAYEANFYIPFLSTLIFALILFFNSLFLKGNWFKLNCVVVVLCSLLPLINNLIVYISV